MITEKYLGHFFIDRPTYLVRRTNYTWDEMMQLYNFVVRICCFQCLLHLNQNILARNNTFSWMDFGQTLWPFILLENSETFIDWCNAKGPITENQNGYHRKSNKNWNPPTQRKVKCAFLLITGTDFWQNWGK